MVVERTGYVPLDQRCEPSYKRCVVSVTKRSHFESNVVRGPIR